MLVLALAVAAIGGGVVACSPSSDGSAAPPVIRRQPTSRPLEECGGAVFNVVAEGDGALTYSWQIDGAAVAGAAAATWTVERTPLAWNGAAVQVVVSNAAGSVTSEPITLVVEPPVGPLTLAATSSPFEIAVDVGRVYWASMDGVGSASLDCSGDQQLLYETNSLTGSGWERPAGLVLTPSRVAWIDANIGIIGTVPKTGGPATAVATGLQIGNYELAASEETLYWANHGPFVYAATQGESPVALAVSTSESSDVSHVVVEPEYIYWTDRGLLSIGRIPVGGGVAELVATAEDAPFSLTLGPDDVFWAEAAVGGGYAVKRAAKGGGDPILVTQRPSPPGLAVDGPTLYIARCDTGGAGWIERVPADGSAAPEVLADGIGCPIGIAIDGSSVYWSEMTTGLIRALPK